MSRCKDGVRLGKLLQPTLTFVRERTHKED
jgi:hypothetical protein